MGAMSAVLGLFFSIAVMAQDGPRDILNNPKKGICLSTKKNKDTWKAMVKALGASWHYSWGAALPEKEVEGVEFVPMVWGYPGKDSKALGQLEELTAAKPNDSQKHLLGFNEPDGKKQANMTVSQALEAWPLLMKTGLRLGSPAAVHADKEWMQEFMKEAATRNYKVDFICVHWYGSTNVESLVNYIREIHKMYGKPIWITEFATADWKAENRKDNKYSPEEVLQFMKAVLPELDKLDFVERYAWFSAGENDKALGPSALFREDGSLTNLGQFYASYKYSGPETDTGKQTGSPPVLPAKAK